MVYKLHHIDVNLCFFYGYIHNLCDYSTYKITINVSFVFFSPQKKKKDLMIHNPMCVGFQL